MKSSTLPNQPDHLFVIGATKAGTTTLFALLNAHPEITTSIIKETNYYCPDLWPLMTDLKPLTLRDVESRITQGKVLHRGLIQDEAIFHTCFPKNPNARYLAEASPFYLRSHRAAEEIFRSHPDARLIAILRDPVERAYSHYRMELRDARVKEPFESHLQEECEEEKTGLRPLHGILESGLYGALLSRYFDQFDRKQILILDFSELRQEEALEKKLGTFLDLDPQSFTRPLQRLNESMEARNATLNRLFASYGIKAGIRKIFPQSFIDAFKPLYYGKQGQKNAMNKTTRRFLQDYYREDLRLLKSLVDTRAWSWAHPD